MHKVYMPSYLHFCVVFNYFIRGGGRVRDRVKLFFLVICKYLYILSV